MSSTRRVMRDERGIYIAINGGRYRPFGSSLDMARCGFTGWRPTKFRVGDRVPARHIPGSTRSIVDDEIWNLL